MVSKGLLQRPSRSMGGTIILVILSQLVDKYEVLPGATSRIPFHCPPFLLPTVLDCTVHSHLPTLWRHMCFDPVPDPATLGILVCFLICHIILGLIYKFIHNIICVAIWGVVCALALAFACISTSGWQGWRWQFYAGDSADTGLVCEDSLSFIVFKLMEWVLCISKKWLC